MPLPRLLRREERLEDAGPGRRVHARSPVSRHREHDVAARRDVEVLARVGLVEPASVGLDRQPSALRHGVARVDGEVHDDLLELGRVGADAGRAWLAATQSQIDVLAAGAAGAWARCRSISGVRVEHRGCEHLPAAEGEQLARERGGLRRRRA